VAGRGVRELAGYRFSSTTSRAARSGFSAAGGGATDGRSPRLWRSSGPLITEAVSSGSGWRPGAADDGAGGDGASAWPGTLGRIAGVGVGNGALGTVVVCLIRAPRGKGMAGVAGGPAGLRSRFYVVEECTTGGLARRWIRLPHGVYVGERGGTICGM